MSSSSERFRIEKEERWRHWVGKIPYLKFPGWEVQPLPPFAGALARFSVRNGDKCVSVYLDVDNSLGFWTDDNGNPEPYWEVYPVNGDTYRCAMDETFSLQHAIAGALVND